MFDEDEFNLKPIKRAVHKKLNQKEFLGFIGGTSILEVNADEWLNHLYKPSQYPLERSKQEVERRELGYDEWFNQQCSRKKNKIKKKKENTHD